MWICVISNTHRDSRDVVFTLCFIGYKLLKDWNQFSIRSCTHVLVHDR